MNLYKFFFIVFSFFSFQILISQSDRFKSAIEKEIEIDSLNKLSYKIYYHSDSAIKLAELALGKSQDIGYKEGQAESLINLGLSYNVKGIFIKAEDCFRQALELYVSINNQRGIARSYHCLAIVQRNFNNFDKCFDFLNKSLEINKKYNYELGLSSNYNLLGNLNQRMNRFDSSIFYYKKSLELRKIIKDSSGLANSLVSLGGVYFQIKKLDSANFYYNESKKIYDLIDDKYGESNIILLRGRTEMEMKNYLSAIELFEESLLFSKNYDFPRLILDSYEGLFKSYKQLKKYKLALKYNDLYSDLKDSIFNIDVNNKITNNLIKFETESKQKEIELLKKDKLLQDASIERQNIVLYSSIALSLLLFILIIGLFMRFRYRSRTNKIIKKQNLEISKQLKIAEEQNVIIIEQNSKLVELNKTKDKYLETIHNELTSAARYVSSILPKKIENSYIQIDWRFFPSMELGGDIFGYHWIDNSNFAFYLLDVSGHGVKSALHSVSVYNALRFENITGIDYRNPNEVFKGLNHHFQMSDFNDLYFTIWYGVLNLKDYTLNYASAGHPPAIIVQNGETSQKLFASNFFIGGLPEFEFINETIKLNSHFKIYLYSDGAYEIPKADGNLMSYDELESFLLQNQLNDINELDLLYNRLMELTNNHLPDDFSILKISVDS